MSTTLIGIIIGALVVAMAVLFWTMTLRPNFDTKVILGNHDKVSTMHQLREEGWINSYSMHLDIKIPEGRAIMTHIPIHHDCLDRWMMNIHAHLHNRSIIASAHSMRYACTSWEVAKRPLNLKAILQEYVSTKEYYDWLGS